MTDGDALAEGDDDLADAENGNTPMPTDRELDALLRVLLAAKGKSEAGKLSGAELSEAKDAIEVLMRDEALLASEPVDAGIEDQIVSLLEKGRKNKAIKLYRKQTGADLKEANEIVEAIAADYGISPKKAGCAGMVLLMVIVFAIIGVGLRVLRG